MPKSVKPIKGLSPDKANANRMTVRGRGRVAYSLGRYGAGRCVVVDEDGNVIAATSPMASRSSSSLNADELGAILTRKRPPPG